MISALVKKPKKEKKAGRRAGALPAAIAFLLAAVMSLTVYGAVVYDSSKDPVVAYSAMEKYVGEQLATLRSAIESLTARVEVVELTGGGGGGGGTGMTTTGAQQILARISALETKYDELKDENTTLRNQLDSARKELSSLVNELQSDVSSINDELYELSESLDAIRNSVTTVKSDVATLAKNFSQISSISTRLETVTYKVNALTSSTGDIAQLKESVSSLNEQLNEVAEEAGRLFIPVHVPYGAVVTADGNDGSAIVILRAGSAEAVSPFTEPATRQGLNDLSDGGELFNGDAIPIYHSLLIPRGDGRGIKVTSVDGAYIMIGGRFTIVEQ